LPAAGEYFRREDFFADDFRAEDFLAVVLLLVLLFFVEELFRVEFELFFAAFFVAISILLENQMFRRFETVVWQVPIGDLPMTGW
jgi:hypothetical protein